MRNRKGDFPPLPSVIGSMASGPTVAAELMVESLRHAFGLALKASGGDRVAALHRVSSEFARIYDPIDMACSDEKSASIARVVRRLPPRSERAHHNLLDITNHS